MMPLASMFPYCQAPSKLSSKRKGNAPSARQDRVVLVWDADTGLSIVHISVVK